MAVSLQAVLPPRGDLRDAGRLIAHIAAREPDRFCVAALSLLDSEPDVNARRRIYNQLVECPEFLVQLMKPDRFSRDRLVEVCRGLMTLDSSFDVRLARLTPGRHGGGSPLEPEAVVLVLDVLNEISTGARLVLLLNHLTEHPDRRIASKATLLVGKRLRNQHWTARRLESDDGRVRANVVEGLWTSPGPSSRTLLWQSLRDKNNRVVGNALIGLHRLGEPSVREFVKRMIEDPRPAFRWTAAWVMGKIGGEEFIGFLERALNDKEPQVRRAAERALAAIRPPVTEEPAVEAPVAAAAAGTPEEKPAEEEAFALRLDGKGPGGGVGPGLSSE